VADVHAVELADGEVARPRAGLGQPGDVHQWSPPWARWSSGVRWRRLARTQEPGILAVLPDSEDAARR
jgi:hypothetical protein